MIIEKGHIFNLMDTNGRRSDVLNALKVYLQIIEEIKEEYPFDDWSNYPNSIVQFIFYKKALAKSKDVFKVHKKYDKFIETIKNEYHLFLDKDCEWVEKVFPKIKKTLDVDIEARSRHYTSNLVKIGFVDTARNITDVGYSYLKNILRRDPLENLLPLDNINILLIRQLLKLKVFGEKNANGMRSFYSPFLMALVLLMGKNAVDKDSFEVIVQGLSPYTDEKTQKEIAENTINISDLENTICDKPIEIPNELVANNDIKYDTFKRYFGSSKDKENIVKIYYNFFIAMKDFYHNKNQQNYTNLLKLANKNKDILNKAFGFGKSIFNYGKSGTQYDLETFLKKNVGHHFLNCDNIVVEIYITFKKSKIADGIKEYSDTTMRLLGATGLFKFKTMPELSYKDILCLIFDINALRKNIFGIMTETEFENYEKLNNCFFYKNTSISGVLQYSDKDINLILTKIKTHLSVNTSDDVKKVLKDEWNAAFIQHIKDKYSKSRIIKILPLFSDRRNDHTINNIVNEAATIPTIYEFIIGVAWYYISGENFDLYNSFNLTMDADFEPVLHAGAGECDILINYEHLIVMLEVSLMNKQAQKRGEWEPVLRHSLNLKAANINKEFITFFVADELDYNTINIWRAVAAVPLESTDTHKMISGAIIMPFTTNDIVNFLEKNVSYNNIIAKVKESFAQIPQLTDVGWHDEILNNLLSN